MKKVVFSVVVVSLLVFVLKRMKREAEQFNQESVGDIIAKDSGKVVWNWLKKLKEIAEELQLYLDHIDFEDEAWVEGFTAEKTALAHRTGHYPVKDLIIYALPAEKRFFQANARLVGVWARLTKGSDEKDRDTLSAAMEVFESELKVMFDLAEKAKQANLKAG